MKKGGKLVVALLSLAVLAAGYGAYKSKSNEKQGLVGYNKLTETEKIVSDEVKKEFEEKESTKPSASDVVIPPDATEEEKEDLAQKKSFLKLSETIEAKIESLYEPIDESVRNTQMGDVAEIKDVFVADGQLLVTANIVSCYNKAYQSFDMMFFLDLENINEIETMDEMSNAVSHSTNDFSVKCSLRNSSPDFNSWVLEKELETIIRPYFEKDATILSESIGPYNEFVPHNSIIIFKTNEDGKHYFVDVPLDYRKSVEEFDQAIEAKDYSDIVCDIGWTKIVELDNRFDWRELKEKHLQEATATASASAENFVTEDGGFDYEAFQKSQSEQSAEKTQDQSSVVFETEDFVATVPSELGL